MEGLGNLRSIQYHLHLTPALSVLEGVVLSTVEATCQLKGHLPEKTESISYVRSCLHTESSRYCVYFVLLHQAVSTIGHGHKHLFGAVQACMGVPRATMLSSD